MQVLDELLQTGCTEQSRSKSGPRINLMVGLQSDFKLVQRFDNVRRTPIGNQNVSKGNSCIRLSRQARLNQSVGQL